MSTTSISRGGRKGVRDEFGMTPEAWRRLEAKTEEEIEAAARADPDNPLLTEEQLSRMHRIPPARFIREHLRLSIEEFAAAYDIPAATMRAWERRDAEPNAVELAYLRAIERAPEAIRKREAAPIA